ncbi:hypothetical protein MLD38_006522 [Melastoma candidum]|uniref:Uncharacterized protein n=1 Tax=Melastoma candidum TaxID=119954 RepID=A0ACB9RWM3_9MYRT|nr:hypothetical protein MLD38_006522 [Melastoma candidum]
MQMQQQQQQQRMKQQQPLCPHPGLLAPPQIEPILSGNLPTGFDSSTWETFILRLQISFFRRFSLVLVQSKVASLFERRSHPMGLLTTMIEGRPAAFAIVTLNGQKLFGQPIKVNWAYASSQREDTSGHFNVFVGDLSAELSCFFTMVVSDAKVMWDQKTEHSRGFGFVSFRNRQDAQSAINDMTGKWLGSRQIRYNWASKGANSCDDKQSSDAKSVVELTSGVSDNGQEKCSDDAPGNNPQYTTLYVGILLRRSHLLTCTTIFTSWVPES